MNMSLAPVHHQSSLLSDKMSTNAVGGSDGRKTLDSYLRQSDCFDRMLTLLEGIFYHTTIEHYIFFCPDCDQTPTVKCVYYLTRVSHIENILYLYICWLVLTSCLQTEQLR